MNSFEFNKIFAAILIAGITLMLSDFVADHVMHPHDLKEDAVHIAGAAVAAEMPTAEPMAEPILHMIATADVAKGQKLSKACAACHSFDDGGPHKVGPNLYGIVGMAVAGKDGYQYSSAMSEKGGEWSYLSLNQYLWKPKKYVPGTKMSYAGLKKPEDRAAIIAWLHTLGSNAPLPSEEEIAEEKAVLGGE